MNQEKNIAGDVRDYQMDSLLKNNCLMLSPIQSSTNHRSTPPVKFKDARHDQIVVPHLPRRLTSHVYKRATENISPIEPMTSREIQILDLLGKGFSVKGVARELFVAPGTVKWHVKNLYRKLSVFSREGALSKARLLQVIP